MFLVLIHREELHATLQGIYRWLPVMRISVEYTRSTKLPRYVSAVGHNTIFLWISQFFDISIQHSEFASINTFAFHIFCGLCLKICHNELCISGYAGRFCNKNPQMLLVAQIWSDCRPILIWSQIRFTLVCLIPTSLFLLVLFVKSSIVNSSE